MYCCVQLPQYLPVSTPLSQGSHAQWCHQCDACCSHRTQKTLGSETSVSKDEETISSMANVGEDHFSSEVSNSP